MLVVLLVILVALVVAGNLYVLAKGRLHLGIGRRVRGRHYFAFLVIGSRTYASLKFGVAYTLFGNPCLVFYLGLFQCGFDYCQISPSRQAELAQEKAAILATSEPATFLSD